MLAFEFFEPHHTGAARLDTPSLGHIQDGERLNAIYGSVPSPYARPPVGKHREMAYGQQTSELMAARGARLPSVTIVRLRKLRPDNVDQYLQALLTEHLGGAC